MPEYLGLHRGQPITSGIAKRPVTGRVPVARPPEPGGRRPGRPGGPRRAGQGGVRLPVRAPAGVGAELGQELGPAPFGENLTHRRLAPRTTSASATAGTGATPCWRCASPARRASSWPCTGAGATSAACSARAAAPAGTCGCSQPGRVPVAGPIAVEPHPWAPPCAAVHEAARPGARAGRGRRGAARPSSPGRRVEAGPGRPPAGLSHPAPARAPYLSLTPTLGENH